MVSVELKKSLYSAHKMLVIKIGKQEIARQYVNNHDEPVLQSWIDEMVACEIIEKGKARHDGKAESKSEQG